ncbi:hypothetical protein ABT218_12520 [Streptomyces sp. NPDC001455]|uniref:hypothetical protein n=1 Tax=Streptomyces sp. NPDC001455 TaxID=3154518 RepID=UPI00331A28FB
MSSTRPWWHRIPSVAVVLTTYAVTGALIYLAVSETSVVWAGGGLALGLLAAFGHGAAQSAYDARQR